MMDENLEPLPEETLAALAERIEALPPDHVHWVVQLFLECRRAREAESRYLAAGCAGVDGSDATQIVLDTADWLHTLWEVGYMGSDTLPTPPRTGFPQINVEDILKSALFARIRLGKRPLPFPPPTRQGVPWHEVVESSDTFQVHAEPAGKEHCIIEGCRDWLVVSGVPGDCVVQYRGKGPLYHLMLDGSGNGTLRRQPATITRCIRRQERANVVAWLLEWPGDDGTVAQVPLRATTWERAETEAQSWVALRYPQLYGQIKYEPCEA